MAKFLIQASYTGDAWQKMLDAPPDRPSAAAELAKALGGEVETFYYLLGEQDFVTIMELPDDASAAALKLAVTSTGRIKDIKVHRLIGREDATDMFAKARAALGGYQVPGG